MMTPGVFVALFLAACGGPVGIVRGDLQDETGLVLPSGRATLAGRVLDVQGNGIAGAILLTEPRGFEALADSKGAYTFPWLPAGEFTVVATRNGWEPERSGLLVLEEGDAQLLDLVLDEEAAEGVLTVTVTDPVGNPVAGAIVTVSDGSEGVADEDGTAVLEGVVGDDLEVQVVDADGDLFPSHLEGVNIAAGGGLQWSPQLSGRSDGDVDSFGQEWCVLCHQEVVEAFAETPHGRAFVREPSDALQDVLVSGMILDIAGATVELWSEAETVHFLLEDADGELLELEVVGFLGETDSQTVPVVAMGEQRYPLPVAWYAGRGDREGHPCSEAGLLAFEPWRWLDDEGRLVFGGEAPDATSSAESQCLPCHVSGFTVSQREDGGVDLLVDEEAGWQDDGVGCERCHGAGESHLYSMSPADVVQPQLLDVERANELCGSCHARTEGLDSGLPHPFGEERPFQPGEELEGSAASSAEYWPSGAAVLGRMQLDELADAAHGPDGAGLRCVDCHAVHGQHGQLRASLLRLDVEDNALCEACHMDSEFSGDSWTALEHMGHRFYDPDGTQEAARCTLCHMPATASDAHWCDETGSGSLSSHRFEALSPQHTVDVFADLGLEQVVVGEVPAHACGDCHAWNAWYFDSLGLSFRGPAGEPSELATHEAFQASYEELYP